MLQSMLKRSAKGVCHLCSSPAPLRDGDGQPYLEAHHIEWLARGGSDTIDNAVPPFFSRRGMSETLGPA
jgi:hypothetical protein